MTFYLNGLTMIQKWIPKNKSHNLSLHAFIVAASYALFGALWIFFSDQLLLLVTNDANYLAQLQTVKGWFFIGLTAVLLFLMVRQVLVSQEAGEASLQQSQQGFRTLLDTIPDLIWLKDVEGNYLSCNATFERFFGAKQHEIVGKSDYDFVDKELADFFRKNDLIAMEAEKPSNNEEWITFADNGYRALLLTTKMPMHDSEGKIIGILGLGRDITELRQAEEAIQKRLVALTKPLKTGAVAFDELFNLEDVQQLQDEFAKATGVASIITNPEGVPLTAPSNFTRLCNDFIRNNEKGCSNCYKSDSIHGGHSQGGPIVQPCLSGGLWDAGAGITVGGYHIANWLIGQVRDETQSEEEMLAYAREIGVDEVSFMAAFHEIPSMDRQQFEQIAQVLFTLANQLSNSAYQNIQQARFINERNLAEDALRQSEATFRKLFEDSSNAILLIDEMGLFVECNQAALDLLKMTREQFLFQPTKLISPEFQPDGRRSSEVAPEMIALAYSKGLHQFDWTCVNAEGREFIVEVSLMPITVNGQTMLHSTWQDITERKQAEKERLKLEIQLRQAQKMESVGRLAGGVAHDFNNMLGVILGHAELGLRRLEPDHTVCNDLKQIKESAERSADLTRQLLAFARKQTVSPKVIDLNKAITNLLTMLQRLIGEDIQLGWQSTPEQCLLNIDPSQIDQLLTNLCVNARDAIENTGRITIETSICSFDADDCAANPEAVPGEFVLLVISDDGKGMDQEVLAHIFEPFYTTKKQGKGTGLGLSTVYGIVKQNNGFINIYSEPDKGTTFSVHLPLFSGKIIQKQSEDAKQTVEKGHEIILLVEDETAILNIIAIMLEEQGYTVLRADKPNQAIRLAKEQAGHLHLLLTDVVMPEMNGRDLSEKIISFTPDLKVLFMSGYTANVIAHRGVLDDGVNFISKPFSRQEIALKVQEMLRAEP